MRYGQPIVADARRVPVSTRQDFQKIKEPDWQQRAWDTWDKVGELRDVTTTRTNIAKRFDYFIGERDDPTADPERVEDGPAVDQLDAEGGPALLRRLVGELLVHFDVVGRAFLVGREPAEVGGRRTWDVFSVLELKREADTTKFRVVDPEGKALDDEPPIDLQNVFHVWRPHPRNRRESDSPVRGVLPLAEELWLTSREIRARALSRLSSGILWVPDTLDFHRPDDEEDEQLAAFERILTARMMQPISDPQAASAVVPMVIKAAAEDIEKARHMPLDRDFEVSLTHRQELQRRIAIGMDLPADIFEPGSLNHWCVDEDTQILTTDGWRRHDDITEGTVVLTLDPESGISEWQPVQEVYRAAVVDEAMMFLESQSHSSVTTLNHRWPVWDVSQGRPDWRISETLRSHHRIWTGVPHGDFPSEAKWSDALVEVVAWYWTEGHRTAGGSVSIAQSHTRNPGRVARIRSALTNLYGPARASLMDRSLGAGWREFRQQNRSSFGGPVTVFYLNRRAAQILDEVAPDKRPSPSFVCELTAAQLELFIDVSAQGDGRQYRAGRLDLWQRNDDELDAYELALILSGRMPIRRRAGDGWEIGVRQTPWVAPIKAAQNRRGAATRRVAPYTGTIWCPVTENQTWLARRDGKPYFTGNTAWLSSDESVERHVGPTVIDILDSLTVGWFRPMLAAAGVDVDGVELWFDASPAIIRPDRSGLALDANRAGVISDEATRRELGFEEADAPTDDEIERKIERGLIGRSTSTGEAGPPELDETPGADQDVDAAALAGAAPIRPFRRRSVS